MEENTVSVKYYLSTTYLETLKRHKERHKSKGNGFGYEIRDINGQAGAIVCGGMGRERNLIVDKRLKDFTPVTRIKGEVNRQGIKVNGQSYMSYRNSFEQYLLDHTILERASTSKHDYMNLYETDGEMFMKLNLQIRFK